MEYIKAITYGFCAPKGSFQSKKAKDSLRLLKERTGATHVIFCLGALQETPQSIVIDYKGKHIVDDQELIDMINYGKKLGMTPIMKPLVNVVNGTWRGHISFFNEDVVCEPKWSEWFKAYSEYQIHYAKIAQETGCMMHIVGCEMVQSNHRSEEWRQVIRDVRKVYKGLVSYNCDKYQEDRITWWDCVDVISASGYYPIDDWDNQLNRIKKVIERFDKAFFFAEAGCMSTEGSQYIPNNWGLVGNIDLKAQESYYLEMFKKLSKESWVEGFGLWDWSWNLYSIEEASSDGLYNIYGKPAELVVKDFYLL